MSIIFLFILCGLLTGIIGGMLGIGGGVITVPMLYFIFRFHHLFESKTMQIAAATSLAISLVIAIASSIAQHRKKAILFAALKYLFPGLIVGCISGTYIADFISSEWLGHIFGASSLLLGLYFTIPALPALYLAKSLNYSLSFFGIVIGALSSMLGIGGGILTFPTLLGYQVEPKIASGTSSFTTALSSLLGSIAYFYVVKTSSTDLLGYIDLKAFAIISMAALCTTSFGVKLSHVCDTRVIKRLFGICLSAVGITMLIR